MNHDIIKTEFNGYGIRKKGSDLYYCLEINNKEKSGLAIYDGKMKLIEKIYISSDLATGNVFCVMIKKCDIFGMLYKVIDGDREYVDEFCQSVYGFNEFGKNISADKIYGRICACNNISEWNKDNILKTDYSDSVFYIAHPRGFSMSDIKASHKGTFKAITDRAQYLKNLGITGLILMPVYERIEIEVKDKLNTSFAEVPGDTKVNYWGFGKGFYYSVKASFSSDIDKADDEFREMIMKLHQKGIEVILSFDFVNLNYDKIASILRYWVFNYHVDGFRLFGVNDLDRLINDPFFKDTKLILENYKNIPNDLSIRYKNIAVFDDEFKNISRKFLKSDDDCVGRISYFVRENHNNYAVLRNITDFDGFSLYDLVSYDRKHNEANNENNEDGTNYNYSWNCGEEGPSDKKAVNKLRLQQMKNAVMISSLCQGTPVITAGDENCNTSLGNNNPYCQDNEIGWTDWNDDSMSKELHKFIKDLLAFRKRHVILHQPQALKLFDYMSCKLPDVSFHGAEAWKYDNNPDSRQFAVLYAGNYSKQYVGNAEDSIMIIYNMHWDAKEFALPEVSGADWKLLCRTDAKCNFKEENSTLIKQRSYIAKGRTVSILISNKK